MQNYPVIQLIAKREQTWLFGHPWIYSRAILEIPSIHPGSLVNVCDHQNRFLGVGYLHPKQTIALRMLDENRTTINEAWFLKRLKLLDAYRKSFLKNQTTAYRLCYGESDGIAGLVIDRYGDFASVQVNTMGVFNLLPPILAALPGIGIKEWVVLGDSLSAKQEGVKVDPHLSNVRSEKIWAQENGLQICIPIHGQKTGWFCDQRDNRAFVQHLSSEHSIESVLNLFSYSGGFSLAALAGGVSRVVNVDIDKNALQLCDEMSIKNRLLLKAELIEENVWNYLNQSQELFQLVIVDPPAFVKQESKKAAGLKGYRDLVKKSICRVCSGGFLMIFSCSHFVKEEDLQWVLRQAFAESGRKFQTVSLLKQGFDHPVPAWFPEASYLKGIVLKEIVEW